ncbi:metallophosphoesterase [Methylobrevis albus]|uniref:Metallophosphoesterase n=1 Tax=Methylobrevis albus TaxID=2793297 RepID=A0A931I4A9_9HYPH|nr:metallophosphoesterase [Methylobrevis albus]
MLRNLRAAVLRVGGRDSTCRGHRRRSLGDDIKLWIFSDLHLEYAPLRELLAIPDADVCVVAGDLCRGPANSVRWLAEHIAPSMPCVFVAGNHEFYKGSIREGLEEGRRAAQESLSCISWRAT